MSQLKPAPKHYPLISKAFAKYGGTIDGPWLKGATVRGTTINMYVPGNDEGNLIVDGDCGDYTPQEMSVFVNIDMGLTLPTSAKLAAEKRAADNDNQFGWSANTVNNEGFKLRLAGFNERLPEADRGNLIWDGLKWLLAGATYKGKTGRIYFTDIDGLLKFVADGVGFVPITERLPALDAVDPADWSDKPVPARDWYADGLVPARNVTLFSGDGGSGKSLTSAQISVAGALGKETLGICPKEGRVVYLAAEDDEDELHRRLAGICDSMEASLEDLRGKMRVIPVAGKDAALGRPDGSKQIKPTAAFAELVDVLVDFRPSLLVLDTSADLFDGDEINRVQVRQFVGMLRAVAMELDISILLLSHPSVAGMQSGSGLSGSTAWNNSVRSRLYLTDVKDDDDARVLTNVKANYGKKGAAIKMRWRDGVFVLDDGKPSVATGLVNRRADETFRDLLSAINRTGQRVAPTKGVNHAPTAMAEHPDAMGITKKQFEAAMQRLLASGIVKVVWEGSPSKKRQRLILASEDYGPDRAAEMEEDRDAA